MPKKIDFEEIDNDKLVNFKITFMPKRCPKCGELMATRFLGVWGYYCIPCMFWWGTYDDGPVVKEKGKK